ncbi:MAG: hypothetical protein AAF289_09285 [Cyanobacteria bacterium P01_A01_bin.135]
MDRSKIVAIVTGAIALLVSIAYLVLVQLIDFRGGMQPAPITGQVTPLMGDVVSMASGNVQRL